MNSSLISKTTFVLALVSCLYLPPAYCNSDGEFPGTGDYSAWKQAKESNEDGVDYSQKGNNTMAIQCYDEAIQLYPYDAMFYFNKGTALKKSAKPTEALAAFKKAIELEPKFASAWFNQGNAQEDLHDFAAAEASFKQAIKLAPKHMRALFNLGEVLLMQHKLNEAKDAFTQAQEIPGNSEKDKQDIADYLADTERQLRVQNK